MFLHQAKEKSIQMKNPGSDAHDVQDYCCR